MKVGVAECLDLDIEMCSLQSVMLVFAASGDPTSVDFIPGTGWARGHAAAEADFKHSNFLAKPKS